MLSAAKELEGFIPEILARNTKMYLYKKVKGEVLSDIVTIPIFKEFLKKILFG